MEIFDELVHQLLAHDPSFSTSAITSRFVDGLKPEIKAIVLVHQPKDLDTASTLAILQEEVLLGTSCKENRRVEVPVKSSLKMNNYSYNQRLLEPIPGEDRRPPGSSRSKPQNEKVAALMAYRKAKGLCYKCGARWGPQHTCYDNVPLHLVEELWQMIAEQKVSEGEAESDSSEDLMTVSVQAVNGSYSGKTVRLQGFIQHQTAVILLDSGSTHTFISEQLACLFPAWRKLDKVINVKVANGGILQCTHEIPDCPWLVQGVHFTNSFKILPLKCYDAILGMDWLERFSPMKIHWVQKRLSFQYQGRKIRFQGLKPSDTRCLAVTGDQLHALQKEGDIWCVVQLYAVQDSPIVAVVVPAEIQKLIDQNAQLFSEPIGVPSNRDITHAIPLLPSTTPFRLRPYRYTPAQKDEIEQQVALLLRNHMIQESTSPFASPALLVKKKMGSGGCVWTSGGSMHIPSKTNFLFPLLRSCLRSYSGLNGSLLWT